MYRLLILLAVFFMGCAGQQKTLQIPNLETTSELLWWCPTPMGDWHVFVDKPSCEDATRPQWDHFPLKVFPEPALEIEVVDAARSWKHWMRRDMFVLTANFSEADVYAVPFGKHDYAAMSAHLYSNHLGAQRGIVKVWNNVELRNRDDIMAHEFGHLLGLRHDQDDERSLMHPSSSPRVPLLEDLDRDIIRRLYPALR